MKDKLTTAVVIVALAALLFPVLARGAAEPSPDAEKYWAQWRGPLGTGVAPHGNPPVEWSDTKNVKWKTAIPGKGYASPVVWGDTIFLQTAVATDRRGRPAGGGGGGGGRSHRRRGPPSVGTDRVHRFTVLAVDRTDGRILWQRVVREEMPRERTHADGSWASPSPVTDGERVYAYFGSYGLYCLDMKGKIRWRKDLGRMQKRMSFGEGSSPALHGDRLAVLQDHEGQSFIVVLDKTTGRQIWRAERDEVSSWSSPLIVQAGGRAQVIASSSPAIRSYDLRTGKLLWKCTGLTLNVVATPVFADDMVFFMSGFRGNA
ncbi:MAG: outer membrane protein assembly factor BamB family protein, partial [Planctomycetota bacterium]